jgi:hypothetical protein
VEWAPELEGAGVEPEFPCPVCANTMLPGATYAEHRQDRTRGAGKVWKLSDGAPALVECERCNGSGVLENRRQRIERRQRTERRG